MTKADALQNVMNTLTHYRALQGAPTEIAVDCGSSDPVVLRNGWSKSSVQKTRFEQQVVFLVVGDGVGQLRMAAAKRIKHGEEWFAIDTEAIKGPEESGYWLLPVKAGA